jgi:hypothetical protein
MMSVSSDRGQPPYNWYVDDIQMAVNTHIFMSNEKGNNLASAFDMAEICKRRSDAI